MFWVLLLPCNQISQPIDIGHAVATLCRKGIDDNLIVPEIHVKSQFVVGALHIKRCHIAHDALHRPVNLHL